MGTVLASSPSALNTHELSASSCQVLNTHELSASAGVGSDILRYRVSADSAGTHHLGREIGTDSPIFTISNSSSDFQQELRPPNAIDGNFENITQVINGREIAPPVFRSAIGKLVSPGCVKMIQYNGKMYAVGPGRW